MQESEHRPGVYVPQLGDDVVYIWEGHKLYFDNTHDKRRGPWLTVVSTDVSPPTCERGRVQALCIQVLYAFLHSAPCTCVCVITRI